MSNIITELLIKLRIEDDHHTEAKVKEAVRTAGIQAQLIVDGLTLAIRSFTDLMSRLSEKMEGLYFLGQRTHTSVLNLQALGFAAKQGGSSVEELQGTLEKFSYNLRSLPGFRVSIKSMGVDADEHREWGDILFDLIARLKDFPEQQKLYQAQRFQIPVHLLDAYTKYLEVTKEQREQAARLDVALGIPANIGERMLRLAEGLARLDMILEKIRLRFVTTFVDKFGDAFDRFGDYLIRNGKKISDVLIAIVEGFGKFLNGVYEFLRFFGLDLANAETWRKIFIALGVVLSIKVLGVLFGIMATLKGIAAFVAANPAIWPIIGIGAAGYAITSRGGIKPWAAEVKERWLGEGGAVDKLIEGGEQVVHPGAREGPRRAVPISPGHRAAYGAGPSVAAHGNLARNQAEAYKAARAEGLSPEASRALVANMSGEDLKNPASYHWDVSHYARGIVQWDDVRSARIKAHFGRNPNEMSVADQVKAAAWEMKNYYPKTWEALQGKDEAHMVRTLVYDYERPGDKPQAVSQRMGFLRGLRNIAVSPAVAAEKSAPSPITTPKPLGSDRGALLKATDRTDIENHLNVETTGVGHSDETARDIGNAAEAATRKAIDDKYTVQKKNPDRVIIEAQ